MKQRGLGLWCLTSRSTILAISWRSVLLVEETGVPEKKTTDKSLTIYDHIMLHQVHLALAGFELTTLVVIGIDCIGSYKSNNHTITTMMATHTHNLQK